MDDIDIEKLKFPIGKFTKPERITSKDIEAWIDDIEKFPLRVETLLDNLSVKQLNWRYRPDGWMIKQVVHHCADSHINSLIRFKLALTEEMPTIRPYYEDRWAELPDALEDDLSYTLSLLKGLHKKWCFLLKRLSPDDLKKVFIHPEHGKHFSLEENIGIYAWHCNHHLAHIQQGIKTGGKYN